MIRGAGMIRGGRPAFGGDDPGASDDVIWRPAGDDPGCGR